MKTQSQIQTTQFAGGGNSTVIDPVFTECVNQLREVSRRIFEICEDPKNPMHECFEGFLPTFEDCINGAADNIAEMARVDFLERMYYAQPSKEIYNA